MILFIVMGLFRLLLAAGNSLVGRMRRQPQEEAHNVQEETAAPQVANYSNFPKLNK